MSARRILVLCVDIDNDFKEKAGKSGPFVGEEDCLSAATALALADPTDTDANSAFQAVKTFRELIKEGHKAEVAVLTGDKGLGHAASFSVSRQLDKVITEFLPEGVVYVTDGASDDEVMPIIQSRVRVDSVKPVVIKQTKELEKTYVVLLEKLRDPHYARVIFGVPGLALFLYFMAGDFGIRIFLGMLGFYFIFRAIGLEERLFRYASEIKLSLERVSFIFYFASIPIALIALWMGFSNVYAMQQLGETNLMKMAAYFLKDVLLLLPVSAVLVILGKVSDIMVEGKKYLLPKYLLAIGSTAVFVGLLFVSADWLLGTVAFSDWISALLFAIIVMYALFFGASWYRKKIILEYDLREKGVYSEMGAFIGRVSKVSPEKDEFTVKTGAGKLIDFKVAMVKQIGENVVVAY